LGSENESSFHNIQFSFGFSRPRHEVGRVLSNENSTKETLPKSNQSQSRSKLRAVSPQLQVKNDKATVQQNMLYQAIALYSCNNFLNLDMANPSDSKEISFEKDDILNVLADNGNWWIVKKVTLEGVSTGLAPRNYLKRI
jgi:hypothetical protein